VKPVQGVASGGCKGLARGTYQGVSGLVIKPVAGVLDATSKTAEGVKNTVTFWDQKTNEDRMRCPRPFYGKEKFYKVYRDLDAEILKALRDKQGEGFKEVALVSSVDVPEGEDPRAFILAVTYGQIVFWNVKKSKIVWSFWPKDVETAEKLDGELKFYLKKEGENKKVMKDLFLNRKLML